MTEHMQTKGWQEVLSEKQARITMGTPNKNDLFLATL